MKSAPEPDAPLVVQTAGWVVAVRFSMAVLLFAGAYLSVHSPRASDAVGRWVALVLGCVLLSYRVRDRLTIGEEGITAEWSPLSFGPIPLVQRRAFVPWSGVVGVEHEYGHEIPFNLYKIILDVEGQRVRFVLWPRTKHKHAALARIVRQANPAAIGLGVRDFVRRWEKEQGIAPPIRLAKGVGGRVRRVR